MNLSSKNRPHFWLFFSVLLIAGIVSSCGIGVRMRALLGGKLQVSVNISENANQNNPISLDLVFVYNEKLSDDLVKMTAKDWFAKREQLRRDYIEGEGVEYLNWEWIPGQKIPLQILPLKANAKAAFVFADYQTPGAHRFRADPFNDIVIHLRESGFYVESVKN
jgi:type VI secretion system protein